MLKTLEKYIEDQPAPGGSRGAARAWYGRDPRFKRLLALSVIAHIAFYAVVLKLEMQSMQARAGGSREPKLVKLVELAPPFDRSSLRAMPEPIKRTDLDRLQFNPERADDVNLVQRSPKPTTQRGDGGRLPSASEIEKHLNQARGSGSSPAPLPPQLPAAQPIQINRAPQLNAPVIAQAPGSQITSAPPAPVPAQRQSAPAPASELQAANQAGSRRGDSTETKTLGLQEIEAQYTAYVRKKIRDVNERIMPRNWIEDMLTKQVSADFEVILARPGRILSVRLSRPSGFSELDRYAREAIYTAGPFEGWPRNAGETIPLRITVYYTPYR